MSKIEEFNLIEKEIILLCSVANMIDSIVNCLTLKLIPTKNNIYEVRFKGIIEKEFFNIILVDLLSEAASLISSRGNNYIDLLENIVKNPNFNVNNSIYKLNTSITRFQNWLNTYATIENMWFQTIEVKCNFKIKRKDLILISGNTKKHNTTRLSGIAKNIKRVFLENEIKIDDVQSIYAINDFDNWIHGDGDIFSYYSSILTKFLNDIRWGIYYYLEPEFFRSYAQNENNPRCYKYRYPLEINHDLAKSYYWDMMNEIRSGGCIFVEFDIPESLKKYY